jgi:hypothetical protein
MIIRNLQKKVIHSLSQFPVVGILGSSVEIKYSSSPKVTKGFWNAFEDLKCQKGFVVYPGTESYPIGKNVFTLPISELDRILC